MAQQQFGLVGVAGDMDGPAVERAEQGDVAGALVGATFGGHVVGAPVADQDGARVLVAEIELDLLERPLDEERGERVRDRPQPGQRQAPGDADEQLLADADVDHAAGVAGRGRRKLRRGDVGQHHRDPRIAVQQVGGGRDEALTHGFHGHLPVLDRRAGPRWGGRAFPGG